MIGNRNNCFITLCGKVREVYSNDISVHFLNRKQSLLSHPVPSNIVGIYSVDRLSTKAQAKNGVPRDIAQQYLYRVQLWKTVGF